MSADEIYLKIGDRRWAVAKSQVISVPGQRTVAKIRTAELPSNGINPAAEVGDLLMVHLPGKAPEPMRVTRVEYNHLISGGADKITTEIVMRGGLGTPPERPWGEVAAEVSGGILATDELKQHLEEQLRAEWRKQARHEAEVRALGTIEDLT